MPRLILRDRQLGVVARQLVTDANGAPCCCGGVCCPAEAPCLPTPYMRCNQGGDIVQATCPENRGYRLKVQATWRSLETTRVGPVYISEGGRPRLVNQLVRVAQFGLTATADYCVSSNPAENTVARLIDGTMRLNGATFQNTTADGDSIFEFAASGDVAIVGNTCRSDQLPVINQAGASTPVVVELLRNGIVQQPNAYVGGLYPIGAAYSATNAALDNLTQIRTRCVETIVRGAITTQYNFADACTGGRFAWNTSSVRALGSPSSFPRPITDYTATLETTWTREYCPCGGTDPQARGGGCSDCGDRSQLEVIA